MAKVDLSKGTIGELKKMAITEDKDGWPTVETIDSVIVRLIESGRLKTRKASKVIKLDPKRITRKVNPDDIRKFIREKFQGVSNYREMTVRVFTSCGNERLGLTSIVNMIFQFPNTIEKKDRVHRASRSLQVALRCYAGGKKLFDEPEKDVYELKSDKKIYL